MSGSAAWAGTARNQWGLTGQEPETLAAYSLISTFQGSGYLQAQSFSSPDPKPSITLPHTCSVPPPRHPPSLCFFHPQMSVSPTRKCLSSSPRNSPPYRIPTPHLGPPTWVVGPGLSVWPFALPPQPSRRRCWLPLLLGGRLLPCWVPGTGTRLTSGHITLSML